MGDIIWKEAVFKVRETWTCLEIDGKELMSMEKERVKIQEGQVMMTAAKSQRRQENTTWRAYDEQSTIGRKMGMEF